MRSEKKSAGPTSLAAVRTTVQRSAPDRTEVSRAEPPSRPAAEPPSLASTARSSRLCRFSIITMAASIIAPIAIAMPPSDMMSAPTPTIRIAMKAIRMPSGRVRMATRADRACSRKTMQTRATMMLSSVSVRSRVSIARAIRSERS